ncbi:outer membrane protein assembly factor BamB family protein [Arthrobacter sp. HY1533]|uniref:outer membrane protein assembly factor BamB family protein n=1 Tax=Arthrobacter sp. HY1533 TaxID=2970919 RepID=UPI0022B9E4F9|nr:PQQ-binding-like beta-propeller repeat protein [Arthrobacter sp. HY1533]
MQNSYLSRRTVIKAGGTAGLAAILAASGAGHASAATFAPLGSSPAQDGPKVFDLGPAIVQFSLMSGQLVGNTLYIGSRNVEPARIVALDVATGLVVAQTELATGHSVQTLTADAEGRTLYAGMLQKSSGPQANVYSWDLRDLGKPATGFGTIGDRDVRDISVAPDGTVFAVGGGSASAPALWEFDAAAGKFVSRGIPEPGATLARAVAATNDTVFFGAGSTLNGGGNASRACLFAYNRATGQFTRVTPRELETDPSIRELAIFGNQLIVGTAASTEQSKMAALELDNVSSYRVATSVGITAKAFARIGDVVYFANEIGLLQYNLTTNAVTPVSFKGPELGEIWGVDALDGKVIVTSAYGFVAAIDPLAGSCTVTDLAAAGAPVQAQTAMGMAAGGGYVYVGGNGSIARHSMTGEPVTYLRAPGEAKDAIMVGNTLYAGMYSGQGIWKYNPDDGLPITQAAAFPKAQNRPLDVTWDSTNGLVLVGAQSDTEAGGSLWSHDPATGASRHFINPIDNTQLLRAVVAQDGVAYLGGGGPQIPDGGTIVAFDPLAGTELWRIAPQDSGTAALAIQGHNLYALSRKGTITVIDVRTRLPIHQASIKNLSYGFGAMVTNNGVVYGVSDTNVFRFDPFNFAVETVLADTKGGWYSGSHLTNDEAGNIYSLRGRNLVRIEVPGRPAVAVEVTARPVGRNTQIQVEVSNTEAVPVDVDLTTAFGSRKFTGIEPGTSAFHRFTVHSAALPAGEVTVRANAVMAGEAVSSTKVVGYTASV